MKIGIDCLDIKPEYKGGINTYTFGLIDGFSSLDTKNNYTIYCNNKNKHLFEKYEKTNNFNVIILEKYNKIIKYIFLSFAFVLNSMKLWQYSMNFYNKVYGFQNIIEDSCDILYTSTTVLNFYDLKIPTIISMHDMQQYHYPEFFSFLQLRMRKFTFESSAKFSTYFQASSQFIKDDLLEIFKNINQNQIVVIPEGVNIEEFSKSKDINVIEKFNLPKGFLFFPAQLWKHKNHITILKALKQLEENGTVIPLVMTGAKYSASDEILNFITENKMDYVYYLGKVDFGDLLSLYKEAKFLITGVLYESSSLPILESVASNTAIIASKTPPNVEMSDNIKMGLFEPLNIDDCAKVIKDRWNMKSHLINEETEYNYNNIKKYSWQNVAIKYLNFIRDIKLC
jgi:glycosyltransferase involved in cell wall biosynthesis